MSTTPAMKAPESQETLQQNLAEIRRLLAEAYQHYFAGSDGHCKSGEGAISLNYPSFFWNEDDGGVQPTIQIYSYVFATSRSESFETSQQALEEVRRWHAEEMAVTYCTSCVMEADDCYCTQEPER